PACPRGRTGRRGRTCRNGRSGRCRTIPAESRSREGRSTFLGGPSALLLGEEVPSLFFRLEHDPRSAVQETGGRKPRPVTLEKPHSLRFSHTTRTERLAQLTPPFAFVVEGRAQLDGQGANHVGGDELSSVPCFHGQPAAEHNLRLHERHRTLH